MKKLPDRTQIIISKKYVDFGSEASMHSLRIEIVSLDPNNNGIQGRQSYFLTINLL